MALQAGSERKLKVHERSGEKGNECVAMKKPTADVWRRSTPAPACVFLGKGCNRRPIRPGKSEGGREEAKSLQQLVRVK